MDQVPPSLDDVLITAELERRPTRTPDYEAENRALTAVAEAMGASPQGILQKLVDTVLDVCRADSAGISILEPGGAHDVFRWYAIAGSLARFAGESMPRESSLCGFVLEHDAPVLVAHPERYFDYPIAMDPPIVEGVMVPFHNEGKPAGTLWVVAHTTSRQFDLEDQRLLMSLSRFASATYQMKSAALTCSRVRLDLAQVLDTSATGIVRCSRELRYVSANSAYAKIVGFPAEQIIGRPIIEVIGQNAFEVKRPYVERVLRGERVEYEEELNYAAGGRKYLHIVYTPWLEGENNVAGWVASVSDLSELKRATVELQERERLRLALLASGAGCWTRNARSGRVEWDARFRELYGLPAEEPASYANWLSRVHPEDLPTVLGLVDEFQQSKSQNTFDCTFRIVRPDGTVSWIESLGQATRDAEGEIIQFTGIELDVTERRRAEEALRESEQRLSMSLDASAAGVWSWDRHTNQSTWDDRLHAQYGLSRESPRTFDIWLSAVHHEDRPRVIRRLDDVLHGHEDEWDLIFRVLRPDGSISWMHNVGRAHRGPDGQVTRLSGINLDITERRLAEEALQARRDEERDRMLHRQSEEALRRSHAELEQRTTQLRRLASQLTLTEQNAREHLAKTLHDGLQQLLFTAGMTLDQAIKANSREHLIRLLQKAHADVKEAMSAARTMSLNLFPPMLHVGGLPAALAWLASRTQEQYGVTVNVIADPQANPQASDSRILLFEAVRELLFNAVKHAHVNRVNVHLALAADETIQIEVSDEGVGFEPDVTLDHKNQQHAGLGLFSIKERLSLLGGQLEIQSAAGKGARFILTMPRTDVQQRPADTTETARHDAAWKEHVIYDSAEDTSKALRILIVDDHAVARAGLRELFSSHAPLKVVGEAADGVEAISQAMALQPDVIVMDVSMPQMNGIEATRQIHRSMPHIQIVGLSTHDDENIERSMRKAGATMYFTKNEGTERILDYLLSLTSRAKGASTN